MFGAVFAGGRFDGADATLVLAKLVRDSRYLKQLQIVFPRGIVLSGFNVVDIHGLHDTLGLPVLVVSRRRPGVSGSRSRPHISPGAR